MTDELSEIETAGRLALQHNDQTIAISPTLLIALVVRIKEAQAETSIEAEAVRIRLKNAEELIEDLIRAETDCDAKLEAAEKRAAYLEDALLTARAALAEATRDV